MPGLQVLTREVAACSLPTCCLLSSLRFRPKKEKGFQVGRKLKRGFWACACACAVLMEPRGLLRDVKQALRAISQALLPIIYEPCRPQAEGRLPAPLDVRVQHL